MSEPQTDAPPPDNTGPPSDNVKTEGDKDVKDRRSRSRSRSRKKRSRKKRKRRRRSRSGSRKRSGSRSRSRSGSGDPRYPGIKPRRHGERRHKSLWDMTPQEAEKLGLLKGLPINIGQTGDFMHADRAGRRIYVGNLPLNVEEKEIRDFFNATMVAAQGPNRKMGDSVLGVFLNLPKRFAFVEFRNAIEATQAMELDGVMFRGLSLKLGRPTNYSASAASIASRNVPKLNLTALGIVSNHVPNGPHKLYIGGLPYNLKEDQVRELLETYGPLRGLFLSYDPASNLSKGYAFAYYLDESVTDAAIEGLNGIQIGEQRIAVRRHESAIKIQQEEQKSTMDSIIPQSKPSIASTVICILEAVSMDDLQDEEERQDIENDIRNECSNYGNVLNLILPGIGVDGKALPGAGKVFVQFTDVPSAEKCKTALHGRTFADRIIVVTYYDETKFKNRDFS